MFSDSDLYLRGVATLIASWEAYALGASSAAVRHLPGVAAAVFPRDPERAFYNNALLKRDLAPAQRGEALDAIEDAYGSVGVTRFTAWVHESDAGMRCDLERRGYIIEESTRAMGMALSEIPMSRPVIELGASDWSGYLHAFGLPPGLLRGADHSAFRLLIACLDGASAATAMAFDHGSDCGIYNVVTLEHARRRGLGTALTALQLHDALGRGRQTASLQATPMAERVYATAGFRDLGRILEYSPRTRIG
jgi:GNAT superfamily N-acetyltransferase